METYSAIYQTIYDKFNVIRDELSPVLNLTSYEMDLINKNSMNFILSTINHYSSSDMKRLFMLIPFAWLNIDRVQLVFIFQYIDRNKKAYESFYGIFSFLFDIIKLDMSNLLLNEISFTNDFIKDFITDRKSILKNLNQKESIDLNFIEIDKEVLKKIKLNLT